MADRTPSRFQCKDCGTCCTSIRELAGEELRSVLERSQGVNGYYFIPDTRHVAPHIFEWELGPIQRLAAKNGLRFPVFPRHVFLDARLRRVLVMEWAMDLRSCPFHAENRCTVYRHRPLICRQYPVIKKRTVSLQCREAIAPPQEMEGEELDLWMENTYPDSNPHAVHAGDILEHNYGTVGRLCREGKLRPAVGWEPRTVNRLAKNNSIGLFAFMVESNLMEEKECSRRIELLSTPSGARRLLMEMKGEV